MTSLTSEPPAHLNATAWHWAVVSERHLKFKRTLLESKSTWCRQTFVSYSVVRWLATLIWSQQLAELNSVWLLWFLASELKGCCFTRMSQTKHFHQTWPMKGRGGGLALPHQVWVYFFLSVAGSCSHVPLFILYLLVSTQSSVTHHHLSHVARCTCH